MLYGQRELNASLAHAQRHVICEVARPSHSIACPPTHQLLYPHCSILCEAAAARRGGMHQAVRLGQSYGRAHVRCGSMCKGEAFNHHVMIKMQITQRQTSCPLRNGQNVCTLGQLVSASSLGGAVGMHVGWCQKLVCTLTSVLRYASIANKRAKKCQGR